MNQQQTFADEDIESFLWQACSSLKLMHTNGIVHRDVKPSNILIHNDVFKLTDMGISLYTEKENNVLI